jgi:hypothetical protein
VDSDKRKTVECCCTTPIDEPKRNDGLMGRWEKIDQENHQKLMDARCDNIQFHVQDREGNITIIESPTSAKRD